MMKIKDQPTTVLAAFLFALDYCSVHDIFPDINDIEDRYNKRDKIKNNIVLELTKRVRNLE